MNASRRFFGKILAAAPIAASMPPNSPQPGDLAIRAARPSRYDPVPTATVYEKGIRAQRELDIERLRRQAEGFDDDPESRLDTRSQFRIAALSDHYGSLRSLSPSSRSRLLREAMAEANRQTWMESAKIRLAYLLKT